MMLILIALGFLLVYLYSARTMSYWKNLNIPHLDPHPIFGNFKDVVFQKRSLVGSYRYIYEQFENSAYIGMYIMRRPAILLKDPNIIKDVIIKDFSSFHDNDMEIDPKEDPIFGNNPFTIRGEQWKVQRQKHTVNFTAVKMKTLYSLVDEGGERMVGFINKEIENSNNRPIEAIELGAKFTTYNVGNCALGIDNRSFDEPNCEMRQMGRDIIEPTFINSIKQLLIFMVPSIARFMTIRLFPLHVTEKFKNLAKDQLQYRRTNNVVRNDFFDWVREYKGQENSLDDIAIQVGGFFLDGFATSSHGINFMMYSLAQNNDVQKTLRKEVDEILYKYNGKISYEVMNNEMPYLEAVIDESLRKFPPLALLSKVCTKPYTLPPATSNSKPLNVEVGTPVIIPLLGLHYDEQYFPDSERFDPTRFLPKNRDKVEKFAYLPFGDGPRACSGKKFGLIQAKVCLIKLVANFELRVNKKTKEPIEFNPKGILLGAKGGIWLDIYKRSDR